MTTADRLRHRAAELDDEATTVRAGHPVASRTLRDIAADLRAIADTLPPDPRGNL